MTSFVNSLYVDKFVHIHWPGATTNCLQYHFNVSPCSCILSILYTNGKYALFFISVVLVLVKQFFGQKWSSAEILTNVMYFRCPALMSKFNKPSQSDFYCLIEFSSIYTCQFPLKFVTKIGKYLCCLTISKQPSFTLYILGQQQYKVDNLIFLICIMLKNWADRRIIIFLYNKKIVYM